MLNNPLTLRQAPARLRDVTRWLAACCLGRRAMIYVQYLVTLRCNLRCTYCDYSRQQTNEMPVADALRRVDEMIALGLRKLSLVGGEPLLYAGLPQLLRHCRTRNVTCNIITNGILFVERARELHDADLIIFSLDGPETVHDAETAPGTHRAVISGIDYCCRHNLPVAINAVLHRGNIAHVDYLLQLSEEYRMPVLFQPAENFPRTVSPSLHRMMLSREQLHEIYTYLIRRQDEGCRIGYSRDHLAAIAAGSALPQCHWAGRLMFTMLPDGRLAPCNPMIFSPDHTWPDTAAGCAAALAQLPPFTCNGCHTAWHEVDDLFSLRLSVLRAYKRLWL